MPIMKTATRNADYTKEYNRKLVLRMLLRERLSRAERARKTGLTRAAMSVIVDDLLAQGMLVELPVEGSAGKGRAPNPLALREDARLAVGVYLCRDSCQVGLVNLAGRSERRLILHREEIQDGEAGLARIAACVEEILAERETDRSRLLGIGVSCPGPVDPEAGTLLDPPGFDGWHYLPVASLLREKTGLPVRLENNAYSLAVKEKNYGEARQLEEFMLLLVDTGVGSGLITHGRLYAGSHGLSGEIGHTSIDFQGDPCPCGGRGCLDLYAAIPHLLRRYGLPYAAWPDVVRRAREGEKDAAAILAREAEVLSIGILNAVNFLDMEAVLLDGDILMAYDLLKGPIEEAVNRAGLARRDRRIQILSASRDADHRVTAAANIFFERFLTPGLGL